MSTMTTVSARMDSDLKNTVEKILETLGLTHSTAINALYAQIALRERIPFELSIPRTEPILTFYAIREAVRTCARRYGLERVYLFGSYARGDAGPASDVDLAVDKGDAHGFALGGFQDDVAQTLGKRVDVVVRSAMDEAFACRIAEDEVMIYER